MSYNLESLTKNSSAQAILRHLGIDKANDVESFLFLKKTALSDPFLFKDMERVSERLKRAIKKKELIIVAGDFDVDGLISTAMLFDYFQAVGANVQFYIPDRFTDGHGLNREAVIQLAKRRPAVVITVDNGITSFEAAKEAKDFGIDLIITDHHDPQPQLPEAFAILNPKCEPRAPERENYLFLAGAGVALYLIRAVHTKLKKDFSLQDYYILAAIASVADVVPLTYDNRILVKKGLAVIRKTKFVGLRMLLNQLYLNGDVFSQDIGFRVAPILNAAGRIESATLAVNLFLAKTPQEAKECIEKLEALNSERKKETKGLVDSLIPQAKELSDRGDKVLILDGNFHQGVIGIAASKIKDMFGKPTIVVSYDALGMVGRASCRSIDGYNIKLGVEKLGDLKIAGGGHYMAAGFSFKKENLEAIRTAFNSTYDDIFRKSSSIIDPDAVIDVQASDIDDEFVSLVHQLEPFGAKHDAPLVRIPGVKLKKVEISKNDHMFFQIEGIERLRGLMFFITEKKLDRSILDKNVTIIGTLTADDQDRIKLLVEEMSLS